jgi:hypothetical protein
MPVGPHKIRPLLPHKNIAVVGISSIGPAEIIAQLEKVRHCEAVLMQQGDVSRFHEDKTLLEYIGNDQRYFYNLTLGYTNYKKLDNYFILSFSEWYFHTKKIFDPQIAQAKKFGFSCVNNRATFHRVLLGYRLYQKNLLDSMIFTQRNWQPRYSTSEQNYLDSLSEFKHYLKTLPLLYDNEPFVRIANLNRYVDHDAFTKCTCNIATESETEIYLSENNFVPLPVVTEKSYKPMLSCQVPIWLAAPGHVAYLKSMGFECMENLLPTNYDNMNTLQKIDIIVDLVSKGKDFIENFYFDHQREILHNHALMHNNTLEDITLQRIRDVIST